MDRKMTGFLQKFLFKNSGSTAVEYGLIAALIVVVLMTALGSLKESLQPLYEAAVSAFT
jgi:pilus assembly protein Flp/PilA